MTARLIVQNWHTECGECGYGRGGWAGSPAREGKPVLEPDSRICPGCGVAFTERELLCTIDRRIEVIDEAAA